MSYFTELGLAEPILRALGAKGYADPTPIQRQAIPALMEGRDLLGIAQTGTGKTAAFSLPSLHRLASDPQPRRNAACRMLVLSPTRELAAQIAENMRGYARFLNLSIQCVFGGVPVGKQARMLVSGTDVLVATPGRLLDLIDQRALTLRNVEIFVLDEADQMMDLGFIHALKRISALLPQDRQSLFFSATMPLSIAELGKQFIKNPVRVEVTPQATTAERVEQYATHLNQSEKQALLTIKLRAGLADQSIDRALVFTRTKHGADRVVRHLSSAGVNAAAIHGNKSQAQRTGALQAFRNGSTPVLVATDIAARGIDVSGVSHVFNFELPNVAEQYVHRIGRTARAGADGVAISFVAPDERAYLKDIERLTGVKLTPMPLPQDFTAEATRLPAPTRKPAEAEAPRGERGDRGQHRRGRGLPARRDDGPRGEGRGEGRGERRFERGPRAERPMRDDMRRPMRDPRERPQERGMEIDPRARPGQHRDAVRSADPRRQRDAAAREGQPQREGYGQRDGQQRREWQPRDGGDRQGHPRQGQKPGGQRAHGKPGMGGDRRFGEMPRGGGRQQGQRGGGKPRV